MAFRRAIFDRVGLFDERLDVGQAGCSGDSEFWHRVLTDGWQCRYEPGAVVFHYHRRDMAGLRKQIFFYMRGHVVALLVQFQRSKNIGNLSRAFITLPGLTSDAWSHANSERGKEIAFSWKRSVAIALV